MRIGYNLACRQVKRRRRTETVSDFDGLIQGDDSKLAPDLATERSFELRALQGAILALPAIQRQVIVLRSLNQLGYAEVGTIVGKSSGAVRVIQHRALQALRRLLEETDFRAISARVGVAEVVQNGATGAPKLQVAQPNAN